MIYFFAWMLGAALFASFLFIKLSDDDAKKMLLEGLDRHGTPRIVLVFVMVMMITAWPVAMLIFTIPPEGDP